MLSPQGIVISSGLSCFACYFLLSLVLSRSKEQTATYLFVCTYIVTNLRATTVTVTTPIGLVFRAVTRC